MKSIFVSFLFLGCFNILLCMEHVPNRFKKEKENELSLAIKENNISQVKKLVTRYSSLAQFNWDNKKDSFDPLAQAIEYNNEEIIKAIFEGCRSYYEDIEAKGCDALLKAAQIGNTALAKIMIRYGKQVNKIHACGDFDCYNTPLGVAVSHDHNELVQLLIGAGASLERSLHTAVKKNDIALCKKLMALGANPRIEDKIGQTAFDYYYCYHYWRDPNGFKMLNVLGQTWQEWATLLLIKAIYSCCSKTQKNTFKEVHLHEK